jgi:hypothetical protein
MVSSHRPRLAWRRPLVASMSRVKTDSSSDHHRALGGRATTLHHAPLAWVGWLFLSLGRSLGPECWPSTVPAFQFFF